MSRLDDLESNCAARRVLVRHWIDLGRISLRTTNGVLSLRGALDRLPKAPNPLAPSDVREIASELRRIYAVRRVQMEFSNWTEKDGVWLRAAVQPLMSLMRPKGMNATGTYVISDQDVAPAMPGVPESKTG